MGLNGVHFPPNAEDLNAHVVEQMRMVSLITAYPVSSSSTGFLQAVPPFDRIIEGLVMRPADVLFPFSVFDKFTPIYLFNNQGLSGSSGTRAWGTSKFRVPLLRKQITLFAVSNVRSTSGISRTIIAVDGFGVGADAQLRYRGDFNRIEFKIGARIDVGPLNVDPRDGELHTLICTYDEASTVVKLYFDGEQRSGSTGTLVSIPTLTRMFFGGFGPGSIDGWDGSGAVSGVADVAWSDGEVKRFANDPFEVLRIERRRRLVPIVPPSAEPSIEDLDVESFICIDDLDVELTTEISLDVDSVVSIDMKSDQTTSIEDLEIEILSGIDNA